jgi:hypothetical protein
MFTTGSVEFHDGFQDNKTHLSFVELITKFETVTAYGMREAVKCTLFETLFIIR